MKDVKSEKSNWQQNKFLSYVLYLSACFWVLYKTYHSNIGMITFLNLITLFVGAYVFGFREGRLGNEVIKAHVEEALFNKEEGYTLLRLSIKDKKKDIFLRGDLSQVFNNSKLVYKIVYNKETLELVKDITFSHKEKGTVFKVSL